MKISHEAITSEREDEVVIYARVGNPEGLKLASSFLEQEQAQIKTPAGSIRVRKETTQGQTTFEMTAKRFIEASTSVSMQEYTTPIDEDVYKLFKSACESFMSKTRYVFNIEKATVQRPGLSATIELTGLKYEVDLFHKDGVDSDWVKIDLEITSLREQLEKLGLTVEDMQLVLAVSALPFEPVSAFVDDRSKSGPMRDLVTAIYSKQFISATQPLPVEMPAEAEKPVEAA